MSLHEFTSVRSHQRAVGLSLHLFYKVGSEKSCMDSSRHSAHGARGRGGGGGGVSSPAVFASRSGSSVVPGKAYTAYYGTHKFIYMLNVDPQVNSKLVVLYISTT